MNYIAIGSAIYGNKGAAAMLETLIQRVSEADDDANFTLFSLYPKQDKKQNKHEELVIIPSSPLLLALKIIPLCLIYRLFRQLRPWLRQRSSVIDHLCRAHIYIDQCGISFNDGRSVFLIYNICVLLPGLLMRIPIVKTAQAMGPFQKSINRFAARLFLPKLHSIFSRGSITFTHLRSLGIANVSESTDLAFLFKYDNTKLNVSFQPSDFFGDEGKIVGVAPSAVAARKAESAGIDYVKAFVGLIGEINRAGHEVVLFPHSARQDTNNHHNNDIPLCRQIYKSLANSRGCKLIDSEMSVAQLRELVGACDCLLTSRFHAMIGALAMNTPCMVVGWSHKYIEIMDLFGLSEHVINYRNCVGKEFLDQAISFISNSGRYQERIKKTLPIIRTLAAEQVTQIVQICCENSD